MCSTTDRRVVAARSRPMIHRDRVVVILLLSGRRNSIRYARIGKSRSLDMGIVLAPATCRSRWEEERIRNDAASRRRASRNEREEEREVGSRKPAKNGRSADAFPKFPRARDGETLKIVRASVTVESSRKERRSSIGHRSRR